MSRPLRILLSAGEASGDRLGAGLARALKRMRPDVELAGMGGEEMAAAGVRIVQPASETAVVGFVEVLRHLPAIRRAMKRLARTMAEERPDLLVPVDFPDFNLRLARKARKSCVPVVYFVSPQVWAWRRGRVQAIRRLVRRMLVLFPFEVRFYEEAGVPVTFVGHPALDRPPARPAEAVLRDAGIDPARTVVALLPGSRRGEVERLLPRMLAAARILLARRPDLEFVIPRAQTVPRESLEPPVRAMGPEAACVLEGSYPEILSACAAGVVASGTATLDAALAGLPMVVVYRLSPPSFLVAKTLVEVEHVALANLVAGRRVVPELIQGECTPARIAEELGRFLDDPEAAGRARAALLEVRERLGGQGALDRAAAAVLREADALTPAVS